MAFISDRLATEGSFLISKIEEVKDRVCGFRGPGHLDQVPYIATWEDLVTDPPPWVLPFISLTDLRASLPLSRSSVFAVSTQGKGKKILQSTDTDLLLADPPPPYPPTMRPAQVAPSVAQAGPSAPPAGPESQGPLGSGRGEGPAAGTQNWKAGHPRPPASDVLVLPLRAYGPSVNRTTNPCSIGHSRPLTCITGRPITSPSL